MKYYDYKKAIDLIEKHKDEISSASLGMHEDWFWTAQTIWENGEPKRQFPDNPKAVYDEYCKAIKSGVSLFSDEIHRFDPCLVGGIYGSAYATPTLQLEFKDGSDKMIPCFWQEGDDMPLGEKVEKMVAFTSGCLSGPVQENITPLSNV
jgi:hypothetical protein